MMLLLNVVGFISVGVFFVFGLVYMLFLWLVMKLVISVMLGIRLIISCVYSLM